MNSGKGIPESLKRNEVEYDTNALIKGFTDGVFGDTNRLTEAQVRDILGILQREMRIAPDGETKEGGGKKKAGHRKRTAKRVKRFWPRKKRSRALSRCLRA